MEKVIEGRAYVNGEILECCIGIEKGKIVSVKKILNGEEKIRIRRGVILPAGIDIHVHFREPGYEYKEDFSTGSLSALYGGITCVADMPNTNPPTLDLISFKEKLSMAEMKSYVDFLLYVGVTEKNIERLDEISKLSNLLKVYLGESTGSLFLDPENLDKLKELNEEKVIVFHAEDGKCLEKHKFRARNLKEYAKSRPAICESVAIRRIVEVLGDTKPKIHIAHISSLAGLKELEHRPNNLTVGATPHHLFFNVECEFTRETFCKVNPPIRGRIDQEGLIDAFLDGAIDLIESDHAPHSLDEKEKDFEEAPCGIPGVETMYPIMLYYFIRKGLPLSRLISAISEKPADLLGINKGKIEEGKDADLAIFNIKNVKRIDDRDLHYKCGFTPFKGFRAIFPERVFIRGEEAIDGEECLIEKGFGRYVGRRE